MAQLVARLVRNEKVGGSNPPSSTTGRHPIRMSVFCMPGRCCGGALLWRRWCSGRCVCFVGPGCSVCPWAAARPRAVRAASFARRVVSKPGQAPPPPMGTAAGPRRPRAPQPDPAATHGHRGRALPPPTGTAAGPRRRPPVHPSPPDPPAPSTLAASGVLVCGGPGPVTAHRRCGLDPPPPIDTGPGFPPGL